jgi:hypothetical protein
MFIKMIDHDIDLGQFSSDSSDYVVLKNYIRRHIPDILRLLMRHGYELKIDKWIFEVIRRNDLETFEFLLQHPIDPNLLGSIADTIKMYNNNEMMRILQSR